MRTIIILTLALLLTGCFSVYDIAPGAIVQNNYGVPPAVDPVTGESLMADALEPAGTNSASVSGAGAQGNSVIIGGRTSPATDLNAELQAQLRDLITNPAP